MPNILEKVDPRAPPLLVDGSGEESGVVLTGSEEPPPPALRVRARRRAARASERLRSRADSTAKSDGLDAEWLRRRTTSRLRRIGDSCCLTLSPLATLGEADIELLRLVKGADGLTISPALVAAGAEAVKRVSKKKSRSLSRPISGWTDVRTAWQSRFSCSSSVSPRVA